MGPVIALGRLVTDVKIESRKEIYLLSQTIKKLGPVGLFRGASPLKDEVLKMTPLQKQTRTGPKPGQRTWFKEVVAIGLQWTSFRGYKQHVSEARQPRESLQRHRHRSLGGEAPTPSTPCWV